MKTDAAGARSVLNSIGAAIKRELWRAEQKNSEDVWKTCRRLSSGRVSLENLRLRGNPYARRHGYARMDPSIINKQSGIFLGSWRRTLPLEKGGGLETTVFNVDPKAGYLEQKDPKPTKATMFDRPVSERAKIETLPRVMKRRQEAVDKATRGRVR